MSAVVFQPTFPPPVLPAPTSGIPCALSLSGATSAVVQVYRRRVRAVSWPILQSGAAPIVHLDGSPFATREVVLSEAGETITLGPGGYSTYSEDLTSTTQDLPWVWAVAQGSLPTGASIVVSGGATVGNGVRLAFDRFGVPTWSGASNDSIVQPHGRPGGAP